MPCSNEVSMTPDELYQRSEIITIGNIVSVDTLDVVNINVENEINSFLIVAITFEIREIIKGGNLRTISLWTCIGDSTCTYLNLTEYIDDIDFIYGNRLSRDEIEMILFPDLASAFSKVDTFTIKSFKDREKLDTYAIDSTLYSYVENSKKLADIYDTLSASKTIAYGSESNFMTLFEMLLFDEVYSCNTDTYFAVAQYYSKHEYITKLRNISKK